MNNPRIQSRSLFNTEYRCGFNYLLLRLFFGALMLSGIHAADAQIYVLSFDGYVEEFDNNGASLNISNWNLAHQYVDNPVGITQVGNDIFVASSGNQYGFGFVTEFDSNGNLVNPTLISSSQNLGAITGSGSTLLIANSNNGYSEYTTSGNTVNSALIPSLIQPYGLTIYGSDVYVFNTDPYNLSNELLSEYTLTGQLVNSAVISGLTSWFNQGAYGLAISGSTMFLSDNLSGTISEYTTSGDLLNSSFITGLTQPYGIAVSGDDIFVLNEGSDPAYGTGSVSEYTTSGELLNASVVSGFTDPLQILVAQPAPEPSTSAITGVGVLIVGWIGRRRSQK